jgi:hypothetical protein
MNSIASKVWETLYPDRRPWDQLPEATQQEWSRMTDIVVDLTGARELRDALERVINHGHADDCLFLNRANGECDCGVDDASAIINKSREVLG